MDQQLSNLDSSIHYSIAEYRREIESHKHIASSTEIYTDGDYSKRVDPETGYVHIENLHNVSYIMYLDANGTIYLHAYKHISEHNLKIITDGIKSLKKSIQTNEEITDFKHLLSTPIEKNNITDMDDVYFEVLLRSQGIVNINNMVCDTCGGDDFKDPVLCDDMKTFECQCNNCDTIFRLAPSKYYMITSKTVFNDVSNIKVNPKFSKGGH